MESRPVIDLARGVLMARLGCSAEDAWEILVETSQHTNIKLRVVADALTSAVTGEALPQVVEDCLVAAAARRQMDGHEPASRG